MFMKKYFIITLLLLSGINYAQFREQTEKPVDIKRSIFNGSPSGLFTNFFNPANFSMSHSVSMSYSAFGGQGVALGVYTNSMAYKLAENVNVEVDASIVNSPYNSFGNNFTDQINGIYLSRAEINYTPSENMFISLQYRGSPVGYSPYYYGGSFRRASAFDYFGY